MTETEPVATADVGRGKWHVAITEPAQPWRKEMVRWRCRPRKMRDDVVDLPLSQTAPEDRCGRCFPAPATPREPTPRPVERPRRPRR